MFDTHFIGFAGDWHGNTKWAMQSLEKFDDENIQTIYHLGDFGVWHGEDGEFYRYAINRRLAENDQHMIVTLGNHENYDLLTTFPLNKEGFAVEYTNPRIWYATRGQLWMHAGLRFASLGGAFSIDKHRRTAHKSWWPQEEITWDNYMALKENMQRLDWSHVDVFLSHDLPAGVDVGPKAFTLGDHLENEAQRQRKILREAYDYALPQYGFHGHWHKYLVNDHVGVNAMTGFSYQTTIYGLTCDGMARNLAVAEIKIGGLVGIRTL